MESKPTKNNKMTKPIATQEHKIAQLEVKMVELEKRIAKLEGDKILNRLRDAHEATRVAKQRFETGLEK
jgi:hypothetical protein